MHASGQELQQAKGKNQTSNYQQASKHMLVKSNLNGPNNTEPYVCVSFFLNGENFIFIWQCNAEGNTHKNVKNTEMHSQPATNYADSVVRWMVMRRSQYRMQNQLAADEIRISCWVIYELSNSLTFI